MSIARHKVLSSDVNNFFSPRSSVQLENNISVSYPNVNSTVNPYDDKDVKIETNISDKTIEMNDDIKFLKLVIKAYEDNPLFIKTVLIVSKTLLEEMIEVLTGNQCEINLGDPKCSCMENSKYRYVDSIYIITQNGRANFKYLFNEDYNILRSHNISLEMVVV